MTPGREESCEAPQNDPLGPPNARRSPSRARPKLERKLIPRCSGNISVKNRFGEKRLLIGPGVRGGLPAARFQSSDENLGPSSRAGEVGDEDLLALAVLESIDLRRPRPGPVRLVRLVDAPEAGTGVKL